MSMDWGNRREWYIEIWGFCSLHILGRVVRGGTAFGTRTVSDCSRSSTGFHRTVGSTVRVPRDNLRHLVALEVRARHRLRPMDGQLDQIDPWSTITLAAFVLIAMLLHEYAAAFFVEQVCLADLGRDSFLGWRTNSIPTTSILGSGSLW